MFAIKYYSMFGRKDGLMTDNKSAVLLFKTQEEAEQYVSNWKLSSGVSQTGDALVEVVEVEVKPVTQKSIRVVSTI